MIRASVKRMVRSVYVMQCGYCTLSETEIGAELTYDHFQPQSAGGSNEADNLVYACHARNEFKGEYWGSTEDTRLLHPIHDDLTLHIQKQMDGNIIGTSNAAELYIRQLHPNRTPLARYRQNKRRTKILQQRYHLDFSHF